MRREEIIDSAAEIVNALTESKLDEVLAAASRPTSKDIFPTDLMTTLLSALKLYNVKVQSFSPVALHMAHILGLTNLQDPKTWAAFISNENRRTLISSFYRRIDNALEFLPKFIELVEHETHTRLSDPGDTRYKDKGILSVLVIEEDNRFSSPERLVETLQSVDAMYRACALMNGLPPEGLAVIACDSGSDKSFDFLGAAKVIECVKELILSLWDRVVFFREKQLEQRIELVNKTLPIYERLGELVKDKKLEPEMAEILRRDVFAATGKFIKSGATIPEIKDVSQHNPRSLMAPEPKLLVSAPEGATGETPPPEGADDEGAVEEAGTDTSRAEGLNFDNLGEAERAALMRLLEKARRTDNQDSPVDGDDENDSTDE